MSHEFFMRQALQWAQKAAQKQEVPVGAIIVKDQKILARGHNLTRSAHDPTAHAEIVVLRKAAKKIGNERLEGCLLYVSLEPCAMCAGAIIQARIPVVVYGAPDPKAGACGSALQVLPHEKLNHRPLVIKEVMAQESIELLQQFFRKRRKIRSEARSL